MGKSRSYSQLEVAAAALVSLQGRKKGGEKLSDGLMRKEDRRDGERCLALNCQWKMTLLCFNLCVVDRTVPKLGGVTTMMLD